MSRIAVVAVGGNALTREHEIGTSEQIEANAHAMAQGIARLHADGWRVVVVHGNGPQVGNLSIQQEESVGLVPPQPLASVNAMTQGQLGSVLVRALDALLGAGTAVAVVSHMVVDPDDPAFVDPTKPIGPFFSAGRAEQLAEERGWVMREDAGRGFRRVVASPRPVELLESAAIRTLVERSHVVLACGGGGIGVLGGVDDGYPGVDAVIDKDAAAASVAISLRADGLILVTGVDAVSINYGTPEQTVVHELGVDAAIRYLGDGQFPPGSMGPKVRSAIDFVQAGGSAAVITSAEHLHDAIDPTTTFGTRIVPSSVMSSL
ncbi:carbamate kinase [Nocardioides daejeonensis]|uniref:carbamate kinase n=1 Tax=Nocardioides daejeonensis TaxID=1046556 RepID=UPI000D74C47F|nr:carbamate kinase [Nocardioides daejeonensis]